MIHLKKTILSFLTVYFLLVGFLRILSPLFPHSPLDLYLRTLTLSASSYVFDKDHWFLGYKVTETSFNDEETTYELSNKNFAKKVRGGYERKDLMIHSIAWAPILPKAFPERVLNFYICEGFYGINHIKKIHYDFTYKGHPTGTTFEVECSSKDRYVQ